MVSPSSILSGGMNAMRKELNFVGRVVKQSTLPLFVLCVAMAIAAPPFAPPFGTWIRLSPDPIVSPRGDGFESAGTFNPAVVKEDGKFVMLYRAQDHKGTSSLGYATSDDGIHFIRRPKPVLISEMPYEKGGGVEEIGRASCRERVEGRMGAGAVKKTHIG